MGLKCFAEKSNIQRVQGEREEKTMQVDYKRDLNHNYMIIRKEGEPDAASYQIRMLQTNSISGILECRMNKMDNCTLFYYDITSRQALNSLYDHRQVGCGFLRMLFQQLMKVLEELGSYLLDPDGLILAPNTVYLTAEPLQFSFCYLPGEKHSVNDQMRELMEYFLPRLNHQEPETVVLGYGLYKTISDPECSLEQIRTLLSRESELLAQPEPFAEEKQEVSEEKEGMRQKAMESFFSDDEEEEEEKESIVWTVAVIVGGLAVLGLVVYLMYAMDVPAFMYLILLAAAAVSILAIALWIKKKERAEEKEMFPFLESGREGIENSEKNPDLHMDRADSEQKIFERNTERNRVQDIFVRNTGRMGQMEQADRKRQEEAEKHLRETASHLLYQKTEPLFIQRHKENFRLVPVSHTELPDIAISKEETTIGKLGTVADVVIPFPTVSRLHAKIHCAQGICLLTDLNSCNGTYVNEVQLEGDIPRKLEDGDEIAFADIKYQFYER